MIHVIEESLIDSLKLVPFLFLTYLAMEYLEHRTGDRTYRMIRRAGKWGPLAGGILGAVPQCGFSAAASNLYAGRVITLGTLLSVFLSTSDEMLPILLSEKAAPALIARILLLKIGIGTAAGFCVDFLMRRKKPEEHSHIHEICEQEHCHCDRGILRSALNHTVRITFFILLASLVLNALLFWGGEETLAEILKNRPIVGPLVAGLVGLIPNCASSVVITQLYLGGTMSFGCMMSGLLVGAGVGVLVLCKVNRNWKENLKIAGLLYLTGTVSGMLIATVRQAAGAFSNF